MVDLALASRHAERVVASTERGLLSSIDTGRTRRPLRDDIAGPLVWPVAGALYLVAGDGTVSRSSDGGRKFTPAGSVGAQPEAFTANGPCELYTAVHGGEVVMSTNAGKSWTTRSTP